METFLASETYPSRAPESEFWSHFEPSNVELEKVFRGSEEDLFLYNRSPAWSSKVGDISNFSTFTSRVGLRENLEWPSKTYAQCSRI